MRRLHILLPLLALIAGSSSATTIFNTFDVGETYEPAFYSSFDYDPAAAPYGDEIDRDLAMAFTVWGGSYSLGSISVATSIRGGANHLDITLAEDNGGLPGATIETWHASGQVPSYPGVFSPLTSFSVLEPVLVVGQSYWVILSATGPTDTSMDWHLNTTGYTGPGAIRNLTNGVGDWTPIDSLSTTMQVVGRLEVVATEATTWSAVKALYR